MPDSHTYDPDYFAPLFAVEHRHFWFRARNRVIAAAARPLVRALSPGYRVLEVGCGTGNVLRALVEACPGGQVVGMDLFGQGLAFARRRSRAALVQGDARTPPFEAAFQVVGLFDVLEHLPDDGAVLRDLRRLLAPGGWLLLTVPARRALWSYFDEASRHARRYERDELDARLRQTGYRVDYLSPYMLSIFPLVWLNRRLSARFSRPGKSEQALAENELRITPGVNEVLAGLLSLEARAVAARKTLPFGTSLIAVAQKIED